MSQLFHITSTEIGTKIISMVILPRLLIQEGQLLVSGERMCTIPVNCLEDIAYPGKLLVGQLTTWHDLNSVD